MPTGITMGYTAWCFQPMQGFFSKFLMGGTQNFGPRRGRSQMGGDLWKKIRLKPKMPTYCKIRPFFSYFKHEIQLKVLLSLKVVKFDTKNVFKFFKFSGTNLGWGGDKPWSKNGDKCQMGGIGKIFAGWGGPPQSPPGKKPCNVVCVKTMQKHGSIKHHDKTKQQYNQLKIIWHNNLSFCFETLFS